MRVLAIDSSLRSTGWAVMDDEELVTYGTIKTDNSLDVIDRINYIAKELKTIFRQKECEYVAMELLVVFRVNSANTIQALTGLYYHLLCEFRKLKYLVAEIPPSQWKSRCGIEGKKREEQKESSKAKVKELYDIEVSDDEADAICIGICASMLEKEEE